MNSGHIEHMDDPNDVVPVLSKAVYDNDEYFGHPLHSFHVEPKDITSLLEVHRNQSLWLCIVSGLNYDLARTYEVVGWILRQPDCDALVAMKAFDSLSGIFFVGKSSEDSYAKSSEALPPLKIISARENTNQHYAIKLAYDLDIMNGVTSEALIAAASSAKAALPANEVSALEIPEATLRKAGKGTVITEEFFVEEPGVLVLPRNTLPCPFEMDGLEPSEFTRMLVQDVHLAMLNRDYLTAQKAINQNSSSPVQQDQLRSWTQDLYAKRIKGTLDQVEILAHRHVSKRLEAVAVSFSSNEKSQSGCYLSFHVHHRETGTVLIRYNFGFNVKDVLYGL
ncbi:MAG: DUF4274 domain-containing protein [Litoreibacter sp.]